MAAAIVLRTHGGPEMLQASPVEVGRPGPTQVRLLHTKIGVNFHDTYVRSGLYRTLALPGILGIEAVGIVEEVGADVAGWKVGDRAAYIASNYGAYASERLLEAKLLLTIPSSVSDQTAASLLLRGLTVEMLVNQVVTVRASSTILVQAAGGGVGQLLCRWARHLGATVIGTAGSDRTAQIATDAGCHHVIRYRTDDVAAQVKALTQGRGVDVAFDAVGKDTFAGSLDSLALRGELVNYGQASGPVTAFDVSRLAAKSNSVSRPIVSHYIIDKQERERMARSVFDALAQGWLSVASSMEFKLADAAQCHRVLESQGASVPLLLVPKVWFAR